MCRGYIAPEYALQHQVSVKSDVYSFGVLVLEIISEQKISTFQTDEENHEPLLNFVSLFITNELIFDTNSTGGCSFMIHYILYRTCFRHGKIGSKAHHIT